MSTVSVDQELCLSSGTCVRLVPGTFTAGQDDLVELTAGGVGPLPVMPGARDAVLGAARRCPAGAITIDDAPDDRRIGDA